MNPDPVLLGAFIGVGGAVIGALLVGILAHWSSKKLLEQTHQNNLHVIQITEFNKAAAVFRAAFVNEMFLLRKNAEKGNQMPDEIIDRNILIAHEKAKIIFEPFVSTADLQGFNKAWEEYKNTDSAYCVQNMGSYKAEMSNAYLTHIQNLLEYVRPKT